ncbi:FxsA family protein [bacterium]|nr:FxsA family protein [bacterium]
MLFRLIVLFTAVPLVELAILIELGQRIGLSNTIAVVILTGFAGAALARSQGFGVVKRIQDELRSGQLPADGLFDGALILAGALLLLTPGLITDLFGFALLLPGSRKILKVYIRKYFRRKIDKGEIHVNYRVEP